jgi:Leucine rich repeat/Leucine Rich repeat
MSVGPTARRLRKLMRFSMRTMIVLALVIGGGMGWLVRGARIQHTAAVAITTAGGLVKYDWEWTSEKGYTGRTERVPEWLSDRIGIDYFGHITSVWLLGNPTVTDTALLPVVRLTHLQQLSVSGGSISDAGLAKLSSMTSLSELDLDHTRFTDAGLEHLKGLTGLSVLSLNGTRITDAGMERLKGLTNLTELNIAGTHVTDAGLAHLKGLRNLSVLNVVNTRITDAGIIELCKSRRGLRLYR